MPEISRFYGIVIGMFSDEHRPPHFHVRYAEYEAVIRIHDLSLAEGRLPPSALRLVTDWAELHRDELLRNWEAIESNGTISKIAPLE